MSIAPFGLASAVCWVLLMLLVSSAASADTDGDGLLDALDAPGYDPNATGTLSLTSRGIEDLDGLSELSPDLLRLNLGANKITSIEQGDLTGLNTQYLFFFNNQISEIEPHAFSGLTIRDLNLNGNQFSDLHLEGGIYEVLFHLGIDRFDIKRLFLDDAQISEFSLEEIANETTEITDLSMVGTRFIGERPSNMSDILSGAHLDRVSIDQTLFELFPDEFTSFANGTGNTLTIIEPEPILGDCDQSGHLEFDDFVCIEMISERDAILATLRLRAGDLNGNGAVDFTDFLHFSGNFGQQSGSYLDGNLDLAGGIGFRDFLVLAKNFNRPRPQGSLAAAAVPEPSSFMMFVIGWILITRYPMRSVGIGRDAGQVVR